MNRCTMNSSIRPVVGAGMAITMVEVTMIAAAAAVADIDADGKSLF